MKKIVIFTLCIFCSLVFGDPANDNISTSTNTGQPKLIMVKPANGSNLAQAPQSNNSTSKKGNKHHKPTKKSHTKIKKNHKTKSTKQHKKQSRT